MSDSRAEEDCAPGASRNDNALSAGGASAALSDALSATTAPGALRVRCTAANCMRFARLPTRLCINHGGGQRCGSQGCTRAARSNGLCSKHGGGKRCNTPGCPRGARAPNSMCKQHGGDACKQCAEPAQSRGLCIRHGGGSKCGVCNLYSVRLKGQWCWSCRKGTARAKQYEAEVEEAILACPSLPRFSYRDRMLPCAPNMRRGDFWFLLEDYSVVLEVDENMHKHYTPECEVTRLQMLHDQRPGSPLHVIRYNPQASMPFKLQVLCDHIARALQSQPARQQQTGIHVDYIGYVEDRMMQLGDAESSMHALAMQEAQEAVRAANGGWKQGAS
jgi:hypothetical protein